VYAAELFSKMRPGMQAIPLEYMDNYKKKCEQADNMSKMASDKAKNVFFEAIPDHNKIKIPDTKNFVKFDDACKDELSKVPVMNETLRHVVPPEVRSMQADFKTQMQN